MPTTAGGRFQTEARGQTVWFNAWGGDPAVNRYLAWVSEEVKRYYAIDLRIVPVADAADAVKRIQTEAQAGRRQGGSVDLLWINGENFRTLKQANLLLTGWAESLPNWRYVDLQKPGTGRFFSRHRGRGVAVGQRPADVYRPPRTNAAAAHQPAGAAGLRQSPSGQRKPTRGRRTSPVPPCWSNC
ncbi:ABC transporter, periplasmic substrate-binding protein YnjB [Klebsiella pneumoniae]|uniref:ABC transporter, periplasmic substrate-binding protein YnjB n=1 Tax=Klebsiella pneumoniae TaxID=573 RepID=A0A2X3JBF9_KLEPN|nr:ABC transporter, periplasmic substrate-binding protein YnjB [Klebsiella pneumoniae]